MSRWVWPLVARASAVLRELPSQWGHGDWHPSNLTWTASGEVAGIFDFGLANRTSAVHDLAVALERSVFSWLDMPSVHIDHDAERALLRGYESVRPLSPLEREGLALVLPVVHVEYALSELEYFADVVRSPENAALAYQYLIGHARWFAAT
jgi:Ser/Thr protein kinase RdoA (MazF antagonist)